MPFNDDGLAVVFSLYTSMTRGEAVSAIADYVWSLMPRERDTDSGGFPDGASVALTAVLEVLESLEARDLALAVGTDLDAGPEDS